MASGNKFLNQDRARACLLESPWIMQAHGSFIQKLDPHAASLPAVERLDYDWVPDLARGGCGAVLVGDADRPGNRETTVAEKVARQLLVGRDLSGDEAVRRDIGGPNALLESPMSELQQRKPPA